MIKIYGSKMSSAGRCYWMAEEVGQTLEQVPLDFQTKQHKSPEYLKLNPNGKVPTIVDGDLVLWESMAINTYLADKYKPELLGTTPELRALANQWSYWSMAHLHHAGHALVMQTYRKTPDSEETTKGREELATLLPILDTALHGKNYLVGDMFSVADLNLVSIIDTLKWAGVDMAPYANITRWVETISQRPAYQKTFKG